ncbi:Olfactory receptor 7G1 [Fukomys damarensis]|uniref:Olfactory receptor 7G1 n=1 Tax=Fukomys damarensis TaxID=885580 RepID=A0A091D1I6_FUKDA|nr:Olfactory receptor 7G1 [Fukomys damarensis]
MKLKNQTAVSGFLLLGLTDDSELQTLVFSLFLSMYLVTVLGNLLIILAVSSDSHLHTPMYFFLSSLLSLSDICMSTTTIPKMLMNIQAQDQSITYPGCLTQSTAVMTFCGVDNCLLAVMAYDHYVAICQPLRYQVILTPDFCVSLVLLSLLISNGHAPLQTPMALRLTFCTNVEIPHFFCELAQIFKLACSDTFVNTLLIYSAANIFFGVPTAGVILSYAKIVFSVFRMPSVAGRSIENIEAINPTAVSEFLFLRPTDDPELQPLIFSWFLTMYLVTILEKLLIILAVSSDSDSHLHTPMYSFLSPMTSADMCISTFIFQKILTNISTFSQSITYTGALTQVGFVLALAFLENFPLDVVAYDCCGPLPPTQSS